MAAMAPALTDATAHSSSFKLPASPANPGQAPQSGVQPLPQDPSSPGLPNGRTEIHCQTAQIQTLKDPTSALQFARTASSDSRINNNHLVKNRISNSVRSLTSNNRPKHLCNGSSPNNHQPSVLQINGHPKTKRVGPGPLQAVPQKELPALRLINGVSTGLKPKGVLNMNQQYNTTVHGSSSSSGSNTAEQESSNLNTMPPQTSSALQPISQTSAACGEQHRGPESRPSPPSLPESPRSNVSTNQNKLDFPSASNISCGQSTSSCDNSGNNTSETMSIEFTEEQSESMAKQQARLEQRARWLASRLRRLQSQATKNHIQRQLGGIVGLHHTKWEVLRKQQHSQTQSSQDPCQQCRQRWSGDAPVDEAKDSSAPSVCTNCNNPQVENPTTVFQRLTRTQDRILAQRILRGEDKDLFKDVKTVSRKLSATLVHGDDGVDSDATDESSGGESCDEGDDAVSYDNRMPQRVPLHKRAIWKWATDRAAIASKWTWLQAQVSDLEYRIRQQSDIYRQIRATKGVVTLGEPLSPEELLCMRTLLATSSRTNRKLSPIEAKIARLGGGGDHTSPSSLSTLLTNVDRQSARLKRSLQNCITPIGQVPPPTHGGTKLHAPKPMNGLVDNTATGRVSGNPLFSSGNPSTSSITTQDPENKRIKIDATGITVTSPTPVPPEELYCARTRPVKYYRKRKLIRTLGIHQSSRKAQKLLSVRCGCCRPNNPCVLCGGKFNHIQKMDMDVMSYTERVAHVDESFHPVLSLPQDIPLSVHFEALLKSGEWQRKPKQRTPKKYRLWGPQGRLGSERRKDRSHDKNRGSSSRNQRTPSRDRRDRVRQKEKSRKLLQKLAAHRFRELKHGQRDGKMSRSFSSPNSLPCTPKDKSSMENELRQVHSEMKKRRAEQLSMVAMMKNRERSNSLPNISPHDLLHDSSPPTPTGDSKPPTPTSLSQSMPGNSLQSFMRAQRRMGSDAYDIDNIVIPYSMLASTRVERLTYKEIMTPKWRVVDSLTTSTDKDQETNGDQEDEEENVSDSEFNLRHSKCEITERQKFISILADQAWSNSRRGARRSRNDSIGGTPEPHSPEASMQEPLLASDPSSAAPSPVPPPETVPTRSSERRRASSVASETLSEYADELPPPPCVVQSWNRRSFPLDEDEVVELGEKEDEPPVVEPPPPNMIETLAQEGGEVGKTTPITTGVSTPDMESSDGELVPEDDPNDPEWTVITMDSKPKKPEAPTKTTLVLKLAKR